MRFSYAILALLWLTLCGPAWAQAPSLFPQSGKTMAALATEPVYLEADKVDFDQQSQIVTAKGGVRVVQGARTIIANALTYDAKRNRVIATGNVVFRDVAGETLYADYAELQPEMRQGVIENLRVRLSDDSRLAARRATRSDGTSKTMDYAVYSPCAPCAKNPDAAPTWQLKAKKVVHDEVRHEIQYQDARLELYGVPVLYSPYLSHPDPELKRRSGFLPPQIRNSSELGFVYRQPYYYSIDASRDWTVEPIVMTKDGFILNNRYRQRLDSGLLDFKFSGGEVEKRSRDNSDRNTQRGHINAAWNQDWNDEWRSTVVLNRVSDKTYLRRYNFGGQDVLISRAQAEGFYGRSYANVRALSFQGLRDFDNSRTTPIVVPQLSYNYVADDAIAGGQWQVDTGLLNIVRRDGTDSSRAVADWQWQRPWQSDNGQLLDLTVRAVAVGYRINDYDNPGTTLAESQDGWRGRAIPQAALSWRLPLTGKVDLNEQKLTSYVEPIVTVVSAPNVGRNSRIPNEDSQTFEFDESNLFSLKRFPGYDRIAGGQRVDYGLQMGLFDEQSRGGKIFIGQSYRWREDNTYAKGSGLDRDLSDVVGKVELNPSEKLDLIYRFRVDSNNAALRRSEFSAVTHTGPVKLGLDYIFLDRLAGGGEFSDREEIGARASWQMTNFWNLSGRVVRDVNANSGTREWGVGITYADECISSGLSLERDFISDGENKPGTALIFRVDLKNLGGEMQKDYFTPQRPESYTGTLLPQYTP
jgi:LPS-assembly protein